ncbi:hypothetical protein [Moraxella lacunata]
MVSELCLRVAENRYGSTGSPRTVFLVAYFLSQNPNLYKSLIHQRRM